MGYYFFKSFALKKKTLPIQTNSKPREYSQDRAKNLDYEKVFENPNIAALMMFVEDCEAFRTASNQKNRQKMAKMMYRNYFKSLVSICQKYIY